MYYNNHRSRKEKNETTEKRGEVGSMRPPQDLSFRFGGRYTCLSTASDPSGAAAEERTFGLTALSDVRRPLSCSEDLKHMQLSESILRRTGGPQSCIGEPFLLPLQSGVR
jgi:hypothetical protein